MIKYLLLTFIVCCSFIFSAEAVEPVQGVVLNHKKEPLRGVRVWNALSDVKTDRLGEFQVDAVDSNDTLRVEYGGKIHEITVNGADNIKLIVDKKNRNITAFSRSGEMFRGTLMNFKGKPVRGAMVYVNDPFEYVKPNKQGEFNIDEVRSSDTIHVVYEGYIHDIAVDGSKGMYIVIGKKNGRRISDDMVNMGAGQVDARYYNGPRNVRTAAQLEATGHSDLVMAMIGMPGVSISWTGRNGRALSRPRVSLRHSLQSPLWVVDGVPMVSGMYDITVMEVAKIEVLPDGAMYGSRGAGGVILVTTKGSFYDQ